MPPKGLAQDGAQGRLPLGSFLCLRSSILRYQELGMAYIEMSSSDAPDMLLAPGILQIPRQTVSFTGQDSLLGRNLFVISLNVGFQISTA